MAKLSVHTWIGNAAAAGSGRYGAVTTQTRQAGCSRQTAYHHRIRVTQAVAEAQAGGPSRAELLEENRRLRQENQELWEWLEQTIDFPQSRQRQFAATAAALGLSLGQTLLLLALVLPRHTCPSRATLGRWVQDAARRAGRVLRLLDEACRPLLLVVCLDEIFFRRQPVLMGVEPHSLTWVLGRRAEDRSGPTWAQALRPWDRVEDVAADGGSGIELGLELAAARRQEEAAKSGQPALPLRKQPDLFHLRQDAQKALRGEWAHAERFWKAAEAIDRERARLDRRGEDKRHCHGGSAAKAWAQAVQAFEEAERKEQAWGRAVAALAVFRPDGRLNDRSWAAAAVAAAAAVLTGPRWAKVCRQLRDPRLLSFLDGMQEELAAAEPDAERREALAALWRWQQARRRQRGAERRSAAAVVRSQVESVLVQRLGEGWQASYRRVARVLRRVVRASSAVECLNSAVRMHQARHRNVSQALLDLQRLFWNNRRFREGQRKDRCPYEHLGLKLPTYDPWELLQMDPDELEQKLSSAGVAA